ncbi:MAG: histidine kinase [Cytophagales bacterium CG18_big_fil_WC_8_21_14_2_50_42_9]|nr:MAG: histidine kinase [Cytophagales bacterium CG18_big_fil_WC_8_21_14_2_50_42_9]
MKTRYFPYKYLIAALFCFAVAALLNLYAYLRHPVAEQFGGNVATQVHTALRKAVRDMNRVKPYLAGDSVSFHDLLRNKPYFPTFIYKNQEAVFWTDHTLVVDRGREAFYHAPQVLENKFGKFLVSGTVYGPYQIQVYIPLERLYGITNKYLSPGLDKEIFGNQPFRIVVDPTSRLIPITYQGRYLFSLQPLTENSTRTISNAAIAFISLGLIILILGLIRISKEVIKQGQYLKSTLLLFLPLISIRLVLLYYAFPFSILEVDAFDPRLYAASFWSPSIGDLILNGLLLLIMTLQLSQIFQQSRIGDSLKNLEANTRFWVRFGCAVVFYLLMLGLYFIYYSSFSNSLLVMDITQSLEFSQYKVLLYSAFIIHTVIFLVMVHMLLQVFYHTDENQEKRKYLYLGLGLAGLLFLILGSLFDKAFVVLLGASLVFYLGVLLARSKKNISVNPSQNYLFIFWIIFISAFTGSLAVYQHYLQQLLDYKEKFAANLLTDRDVQGEYLLGDIAQQIQKDRIIQSKITNPFTNSDFIQQKIVKYYLRNYFDRYETTVQIYSNLDSSSNDAGINSLRAYKANNLYNALPTEHPGLYLVKKDMQPYARQYIMLIPVAGTYGSPAVIVLELSLKKMMPYSVIPELLVDQQYFQPLYNRAFSYALYHNNTLRYNEGDFEYVHVFNRKTLYSSGLFTSGIRLAGFHHWGVKGSDGRIVIVSTAQYSSLDVISNFSFLFLLHTFVFLLYMLVFLMFRGGIRRALDTNFSTKIQLFLNIGILIPLLVVSISTASLVTASYKRDLQDTYEKRGRLVQTNILNSRWWASHRTDRDALREEVSNIANLTEADLNIYDHTGKLINSSQPLIFEAGLLSRYMNPEAFADIKENHAQRILLREQTGAISFNALYLPLPSVHQENGVDGFIGIPFFDSEKELDSKLIQLLTTIMNIFAAMFIFFLVITNWAARALTVPLMLVTQKLKQTTLTGKNEMLEYQSADEIGILVNEYNQMLLKLEENKNELAIREKEAAWREMARQVAHEIKNPLTPMKLSLQYLQKAIAEKRDNMEALISKISQTLITQIEILSDIATSFSNFTALPDLKPEKLNISSVLKQSLDLHSNPAEVHITTDIQEGDFEVMADENILMRSFNNLIINAIQAIPSNRRPQIKVSLQAKYGHVLISFEDNGCGVPADIRHKIFVPNFSTKFTGSGIGLAVVKKGIESAGGRIWFETEENVGTTFYIELPLTQE